MAHYYNLVAGTSVPIMIEDAQQICEGQSIQLVVEDINNCANGTPQFVTYTTAPQHPEAGAFQQPNILGNQLTGVPLDQRQNVYIIKTTNDLPVQQNALKADVIHTSLANDGLVNLVDERGSKLLTNNIHEVQQQQPQQQQQQQQQQQIQWLMPENNINYEASMKSGQKMSPTVKTPQQRSTQSLTLQSPGQCTTQSASQQQYNVPGPSDKKPQKIYKRKSAAGVAGGCTGRVSLGGNTGDSVLPVKKTPQPRRKISPKPQPPQQSPQLQTALTSGTSPVGERSRSTNSNLTNNSKSPNNVGNNLAANYRAKTFGTPLSKAMAQNPTARQQTTPGGTRPAILKTSEASGQARNTTATSQAMKNLPALHYPAMNALSERIKQDQMKKVMNVISAMSPANAGVSAPPVASPRAPLHTVLPRQQQTPPTQRANQQSATVAQRTPLQIANNDKNIQRQQQLAQSAIQQRQQTQQTNTQQLATADPRQMIEIIKKQTSMACQQKYQRDTQTTTVSDNEERMEIDSGTSECGMDTTDANNDNQDGQMDDITSQSVAYLQKTIDSPHTTIVQDQIKGNTVKMLVVPQNREQRLITFDIPNEPCTVLDLLEQANIAFCEETSVSLVSDRMLGINYIVEGGSHMVSCPDIAEPTETYQVQENMNVLPDSSSPNFGASDENSNSSVTQNEEPKYVDGKVAVCPNCGISSLDFNRCSRCKKRLPDNVKAVSMVPDSSAKDMISIDSFYKKSSEQNSLSKVDSQICNKRANKGGRRPAAKKRPVKEPECLIISSDEEDDGTGKRRKSDSAVTNSSSLGGNLANAANDEPDTIHEKEPVITNCSSGTSTEQSVDSEAGGIKGGGREDQNFEDGSVNKPNTSLQCRTVRIGSYKYVPREPIVISHSGVRFAVPLLEDEKSFVNLDVKFKDIVKVLIHFGKVMPVLFFYTTTTMGTMIREVLGMQDTKGPYYDPAGKDHTHKRITLLPERISDESKSILKKLFLPYRVLEELNPKEANDILVRASPKDHTQNAQSQSMTTRRQGQNIAANNNANGGEIQVMTVYPPPPAKGGIAINTEDYICLGVDQFLNDAIIDFYLRYLTLEVLSKSDHNRTHVFSSYFYKRLTSPHAQAGESPATLTPAARRHARVQKWTKNVNIFEKDFIIIPINEHAHWFLAIICYPGLVGKVVAPPIPTRDSSIAKTMQKSKKMKEIKLQAVTIGSTTITPVATTITIDQMDEGSERDEAEGDDDEMEMDSDDDDEAEEPSPSFSPLTPDMEESSMVKIPCILIFDSLAGASRSRVVATLRDYLTCEHLAKVGTDKTFSKDTIKGSSPKVPQQSNFTDCGLYLLQYVESFFKDPIRNYTLPIKTLKNWFEEIVVTRKREELAKLLVKLMNQTKGDKTIVLPIVQFPTQAGKLKPKPEPPADMKTPKTETDGKKKLIQQQTQQTATGAEDKTRLVAVSTSSVLTTSENSNEKEVAQRTTYQIVLPPSMSSSENNSPETLFDPKPRSSSGTLSYLRNKRIPRLIREHESQETQNAAAAKKQKGDNDSITKNLNNSSSSSSSGSSIVSLAKSVTATNYDSCK